MIQKKIYTCETAVNSDSIVCDFWDSHCTDPNAERQYYFTVTHNTPLATPIVIAIFKDEQVNSLLIGRKIGKGTNAPLTIIYGGLIGVCNQNSGIIYSTLKNLSEVHRQVHIRYINAKHTLFPLLQKRIPLLQRNHPLIFQKHWQLDLPASYEEFMSKQKRKHRYWQRRIKTKLFDQFKDEAAMCVIETSEDINRTIHEIEQISKKTYQWKIGAGLENNDRNRERLACTARQGNLRIFLMHIKGVPVAFWQATLFRGTLFLGSTGYDPAYKSYEIGSILFHFMIEHCINDTAIKKVDFGLGDASYKERNGTGYFNEVNLSLNISHPFPVLKNIATYLKTVLKTVLKTLVFYFFSRSKIKNFLYAGEQTMANTP